MNKEDIDDIKTVLNEQLDSLKRLGKMPLSLSASGPSLEIWKDYQTIYNDILECNKVMMEIICGASGGIEKLVERNK